MTMKTARGFKGRYFTLSAIQALNSEVKLHSLKNSFISHAALYNILDDKEEDDPPDEPLVCPCAKNSKKEGSNPCHCNCLFRRRAWLLFHLSKFFRRTLCRCRKTKTGLAPPFTAATVNDGQVVKFTGLAFNTVIVCHKYMIFNR